MDKKTINELVEKINKKCEVNKIPAVFSYNNKARSFECKSKLIPDQMLLIHTQKISINDVNLWFERTIKFVINKQNGTRA